MNSWVNEIVDGELKIDKFAIMVDDVYIISLSNHNGWYQISDYDMDGWWLIVKFNAGGCDFVIWHCWLDHPPQSSIYIYLFRWFTNRNDHFIVQHISTQCLISTVQWLMMTSIVCLLPCNRRWWPIANDSCQKHEPLMVTDGYWWLLKGTGSQLAIHIPTLDGLKAVGADLSLPPLTTGQIFTTMNRRC